MRKGIEAITGGEAPAHRREFLVVHPPSRRPPRTEGHGRSGRGLPGASNQVPVRYRTANTGDGAWGVAASNVRATEL